MFNGLIIVTILLAAIDWWAAHTNRKPIEYVFKPLTMVALMGAAASIADPVNGAADGRQIQIIMVVGLFLSLLGDVFLMVGESTFVQGLGSFLLAHVAYIAGLAMLGVHPLGIVLGAVVVGIAVALVAPRIVAGARTVDPRLGGAVSVYLTVISLMVVVAFGTHNAWAIAGALLFYFSDACIGWDRFVKPLPFRHLLVMVTYHLGQIGLVLSLTI